MFDLSWTETALVLLVGLVVIGPEELPQVIRKVRRIFKQMKQMARDFTAEAESLLETSEINETVNRIEEDVTYITNEQGARYASYSLDDLKDIIPPLKPDDGKSTL